MKRIIALTLAALMLMCSFVACSSSKTNEDDKNTNTAEKTEAKTEDKTEDKKTADNDEDVQYITDKGALVIGVTEYEPMNYKDSDGNWTGFDTEFAEAVCKKLGLKAEFFVIDWDYKFTELEAKGIDCVWNGMTITDEVKLNSSVTNPYINNSQVVVMKSSASGNYNIDDLSFAAESGSAGEAVLNDRGYDVTVVQTQADALLEVKSGSCDACVIDETMAKAMTGAGTSYEDLTATEVLQQEEYGISFRKDSGMVAKVNDIMDEMKADGSLKALADKYELSLAE